MRERDRALVDGRDPFRAEQPRSAAIDAGLFDIIVAIIRIGKLPHARLTTAEGPSDIICTIRPLHLGVHTFLLLLPFSTTIFN